jgi:hypothetical protein
MIVQPPDWEAFCSAVRVQLAGFDTCGFLVLIGTL